MNQQDTNDQNTSQPYESPRLDVLGTVAALTQGGSGSYGDSASLGEDSNGGGSGTF